MKKHQFLLIAIFALAIGKIYAGPVDAQRAQQLGQRFMSAAKGSQQTNIQLVHTAATRGAVGGPKRAASTVNARSTDRYICKFWAGELAEVAVIGDGDCDLDLYIYDENGNLIASDTDYTDQCICRRVPSWTGAFTIKIVNRGYVYSNYIIATN